MSPKIIKILRGWYNKKFKDELNVLFDKMIREEIKNCIGS